MNQPMNHPLPTRPLRLGNRRLDLAGSVLAGLLEHRAARGGLAIALLLLGCAALAPWLAPHSPLAQQSSGVLLPPAWLAGGNWSYPLGTDSVGRDLLSRLLAGCRLSLLTGALVVGCSMPAGVALGLLAGYLRGWADALTMRVVDVLLALPGLLLAIALVAVLGPSLRNAVIATALVALPGYVRLTRAAVLAETGKDYVAAARMAGAGPLHLMLRTLLPSALAPVIVQSTLGFSSAVIEVAALGFLGLGAQPPSPEWGTMLADAMAFMQSAWWVVAFPGLAIFVTVLGFNLLGDGLRDALDPRLRG